MTPPSSEEDISETPRPGTIESQERGDWSCITETSGRIALLPFDDYIFSLYVTRDSLVVGTIFGRVLQYFFPSKTQLLGGTFELFQAHAEDSIRSVYTTKSHTYCVIGNHVCLVFDRLGRDTAIRLDRRISPQIKYVLQDTDRVLIPSLGITLVYEFETGTTYLSPLRLPDSDVVPLDFKEDCLITYLHPGDSGAAPALKILKLSLSTEEPLWNTTVDCIFHQELPRSVTGLTKAKFWGPDKLAFVTNGIHMYVFDVSSGVRLGHWKTSNSDIVLLDASNEHRLVTVDTQSRLRVWKLTTPLQYVYEIKLSATFHLNQVYLSVQKDNLFFYSADSELSFVTLRACF